MSDCEETDAFWESWTWTPGKGEKKKKSKKEKKGLKLKNNITMRTNENIQKKKKNSKFKDAMEGRKEKKKGKKKKRLSIKLDDSLILTQGSSAQIMPAVRPQTLNPHSIDELKPDQDCKKKSKREKKVAFDLSSGNTSVKRPEFVCSSQWSLKKSILSENEAVRDGESCSQVTVTGHSHGQTHANESQCTSEDINSQDLFITQKTFRASPSQPSSGEASDRAVTSSPQVFTLQDELHTSMSWTKQHLEGSYKCPQDLHFHQHRRKTNEHVQKPKTPPVLLTEEEKERLSKAHQDFKKEKKVSRPAHTTPSVLNAYMGEPFDVSPSLDVAKSKKHSPSSRQQPPSYLSHEPSVPPPMSIGSTSTQTENFFTTELSSYLNFCQKSRVTMHLEDLQPLDLSLPQRARKDLGMCLSVITLSLPGEIKGRNHKEPNMPPCSSDMKDAAVKEEPSGHPPWPVSTQGKRGTTLSPQSESEPKSADMTTSSEDEPPCRSGKLDLTQVRAVQMRLNESFFFKTKGEGKSPRPESPLMKLVQGRRMKKSRKGH